MIEATEADYGYEFRGMTLPYRMLTGIQRYVDHGIAPGSFLKAIISNDLRSAVEHADDENMVLIPAYVGYLFNKVPGGCWGSAEIYERHMESKNGD